MAITRIDIETFLSFDGKYPVIDVRSEGEYAHAHIPGAFSMPLFNNEERKIIGTEYKKESRQKAIKTGLALFGKKMVQMVETIEQLFENKTEETDKALPKTVVVHCWRGGMRSGGVSWLLDLYGFKVFTITGGYKAYRRWAIQQLEKDYQIKVIGGFTGSGKTGALHEMRKLNQVVIDLEDLAMHKGSAFGNIGMPPQPSQEMFENLLALELKKADDRCKMTDDREEDDRCKMTDDRCLITDVGDEALSSVNYQLSTAPSSVNGHLSSVNYHPSTAHPSFIWLEDESQRIGLVTIPATLFKKIRTKPVYFLAIPFEERLQHIVAEYGNSNREELVNAVTRIQKRLGGLETKTAVSYLMEGNITESFRILLKYYDKQYVKGLQSRESLNDILINIESNTTDAAYNAKQIIAKQTEKVHA